MAHWKRLLTLALVVTILYPFSTFGNAQEEDDQVAALMADMSSAAKVGQLFVVTFPGNAVTNDALITELIRDYHIGGVILLPQNNNIINQGDTPTQVATLVSQLQDTTWQATQPLTDAESVEQPFVPLFIAVNHEGNDASFTAISNGTTSLPSEMTLGASWNPSHAETVGRITGQELRAMGVNMLLGPSLDVLEDPRPESAGDLGVRSFGGEPFWVGKMGQAYIRGVHSGSEGQIAVVAKHFPGLGAADRSLDEEISTVQRTLEKLKQVDLAPFLAVAQAEDPTARPDGLLVSHIRFRGLEGSAYATTRPISVDSQALQGFLQLPGLTTWREDGGVTVSDGLGVRALQRYYDPNEETFNSRRIAREAFLAGNDILVLDNFALTNSWEQRADNVKNTISFFQERYESDPAFQSQVDASVRRILQLKLSIYGDRSGFTPYNVQPTIENVTERVGGNQERQTVIARDAITLLSPPSPDLAPVPPTAADNLVIFTDAQTQQPCAVCEPVPLISPTILEETIVRLYGPRGTGQVTPWRVQSFTYSELEAYMDGPPPDDEESPSEIYQTVEASLENANWIIFAMLKPAQGAPQGSVVRRFLAEYADTLLNPNLIVLAYDAPYYLDATEVNKLTAYYAAYSHTGPSIEASIRALFGEFAPTGFPPVDVPGINYDLLTRTSPDPNQSITLDYEIIESGEESTPQPTEEISATPEPTEEAQATVEPKPDVGDELKLQTSLILDRNGHPVPDGTPVQFIFTYPQEAYESPLTTITQGGIAETTVTLRRAGQLDIAVQVDPGPRTVALQVIVQNGEAVIQTPSPDPTQTPLPTATPTLEPTPAQTVTPTQEAGNGEEPTTSDGAHVGSLLLAVLSALAVGGSGYYVARFNNHSTEQALRLSLWSVIGGLALYIAYALRLPGIGWLGDRDNIWVTWWITLLGSAITLTIAWAVVVWRRSRE